MELQGKDTVPKLKPLSFVPVLVLYLQSPMGTMCILMFNIHKSTFCPHSVFMLCASQNRQQSFPYTDWILRRRRSVCTARYEVCALRRHVKNPSLA
jgi:hypothetical protein